MQHQFVITIDSRVSPDFALSFLRNINFIKTIKPKKEKSKAKPELQEVSLLAEKTLAEEWLTEDDNRWDKVL